MIIIYDGAQIGGRAGPSLYSAAFFFNILSCFPQCKRFPISKLSDSYWIDDDRVVDSAADDDDDDDFYPIFLRRDKRTKREKKIKIFFFF